jgi:hypothetical protein
VSDTSSAIGLRRADLRNAVRLVAPVRLGLSARA